MARRLVITCLSPSSVVIEDLGVRLSGQGSSAFVLESSATASSDLRARVSERLVSVSREPSLRVWPVARPTRPPPGLESPSSLSQQTSAPLPSVPSSDPELLRVLTDISGKLGDLLRRPSPPPAEVVAAHVRSIASRAFVPDGLPGAAHPQFIPSTIVPTESAADIKVKQAESSVGVDDSVSALKKLRRNQA
jgi:hypothetical protein